MHLLIGFLSLVAGLIALFLIGAFFAKRSYSISRFIVIDRPKTEVFDYIKYLKNQDFYSKWVMSDPQLKKTFKGTDGTVGFIYAWEGNKQAGKGEQEIKQIKEGELLLIEIRFEKPFEGVSFTPFTTESLSATQTKVTWGMSSTMKYPMNIMTLIVDKLLGKDLEISLSNLKRLLEQKT